MAVAVRFRFVPPERCAFWPSLYFEDSLLPGDQGARAHCPEVNAIGETAADGGLTRSPLLGRLIRDRSCRLLCSVLQIWLAPRRAK